MIRELHVGDRLYRVYDGEPLTIEHMRVTRLTKEYAWFDNQEHLLSFGCVRRMSLAAAQREARTPPAAAAAYVSECKRALDDAEKALDAAKKLHLQTLRDWNVQRGTK